MTVNVARLLGLAAGAMGLLGAGALLAASRISLGTGAPENSSSAAPVGSAASAAPPAMPHDSSVKARNVFRPERSPAPIPFDPRGTQQLPPAPEPVPAFALVGVLLGPARAAVIRGIPGFDAPQVMAEGEERDQLRVVRIEVTYVAILWRGDSLRLELPKEGM
jgi:hypothetical protein